MRNLPQQAYEFKKYKILLQRCLVNHMKISTNENFPLHSIGTLLQNPGMEPLKQTAVFKDIMFMIIAYGLLFSHNILQ